MLRSFSHLHDVAFVNDDWLIYMSKSKRSNWDLQARNQTAEVQKYEEAFSLSR